jgi:hypothetical protein
MNVCMYVCMYGWAWLGIRHGNAGTGLVGWAWLGHFSIMLGLGRAGFECLGFWLDWV